MTSFKIFLIFCFNFSVLCSAQKGRFVSKPNIIYILADDLGYGDIGCYGQKKIATPNIDKLAKEGMLFTQHYSGAPVCAPSRSALMTGLHTGHTFVRGNLEVKPEGQYPISEKTFTIAELLQQSGYVTAAFGKWGLGSPGSEGDPLKQGFNAFYGYNCQKLAHNYYPNYLWENDKKVLLTGNEGLKNEQYAPDLIHQKALSFIEKNQKEPFFLYYASPLPHAELVAPQANVFKFLGKFNPEKEYKAKANTEEIKRGEYASQPNCHAAFAAMVSLLDEQVGELVAKIKELGLEEKTLIVFTSDNGPHQECGADPIYFDSNAGLRGFKRDLYEGGIRVPMIVKWKGKITEGSKTNHISAFWDVMPTVAALSSFKIESKIDGISFLPTLLNIGKQKEHKYLYWEFHELGGRQAVRYGNWKLIQYNVKKNGRFELYNLEKDRSETTNLASRFPEKVDQLSKLLKSSRTDSEVFKFN